MRAEFTAELEQLRLQVELMAVRVDDVLGVMERALEHPWSSLGTEAEAIDVEVDAMNVSLTGRCYELLLRESPMATDLRLVVSVVRVLNELERISDAAVAACRTVDETTSPGGSIGDLLATLADEVVRRYRLALQAWGSLDLHRAEELVGGSRLVDALHVRLVRELMELDGTAAVPTAVAAAGIGRSLERISDHTTVIGARIRYLVTGDPAHLAAEVR